MYITFTLRAKYFMKSHSSYTVSLAPGYFTDAFFTPAEFQKSPEIFVSCRFDVLISVFSHILLSLMKSCGFDSFRFFSD